MLDESCYVTCFSLEKDDTARQNSRSARNFFKLFPAADPRGGNGVYGADWSDLNGPAGYPGEPPRTTSGIGSPP